MYSGPYPLVPPRARPQNMHYWEMALVSDVTSIFVQLVINVCLLRVGSLSCFAVRTRFADLRYYRASETWHSVAKTSSSPNNSAISTCFQARRTDGSITPGPVRHVALFVFVRLACISGRVAKAALMGVPPVQQSRGMDMVPSMFSYNI